MDSGTLLYLRWDFLSQLFRARSHCEQLIVLPNFYKVNLKYDESKVWKMLLRVFLHSNLLIWLTKIVE